MANQNERAETNMQRVARGQQEAERQQREQRRQQDQAAFEAELKRRTRAGWPGTDASFEAAWENGLRDQLVGQETARNLEEYREKVRNKSGGWL